MIYSIQFINETEPRFAATRDKMIEIVNNYITEHLGDEEDLKLDLLALLIHNINKANFTIEDICEVKSYRIEV